VSMAPNRTRARGVSAGGAGGSDAVYVAELVDGVTSRRRASAALGTLACSALGGARGGWRPTPRHHDPRSHDAQAREDAGRSRPECDAPDRAVALRPQVPLRKVGTHLNDVGLGNLRSKGVRVAVETGGGGTAQVQHHRIPLFTEVTG